METININDDGVKEVEKLPIEVKATQEVVTFKGTLETLNSQIESIQVSINNLQGRLVELNTLKSKLSKEVDKLPERVDVIIDPIIEEVIK